MTALHRLSALALAASLAASPAYAGSIEITVRHQDGWPIVEQKMVLIPLSAMRELSRTGGILGPFTNIEATDDDGRATFPGLSPGTYTVGVFGPLDDPLLVKPERNPLAPVPIVTLDAEDDRRQIAVELWPGVPVHLEVAGLAGVSPDGFRAVFRHPGTGVEAKESFSSAPFLERLLVPSVWEVSVRPKPGFEWVSTELGGERLESSTARLDLAQQPVKSSPRWTFRASGVIPQTSVEEDAPDDAPLTIQLRAEGSRLVRSTIEIYPLADPSDPLRSITVIWGDTGVSDLPPGDYLVVAGSRNTLEGRAELLGFDGGAEPRNLEILIPDGAAIRLEALDPEHRPVSDLEVDIERLGDDPEIMLRDDAFRQSKRRRAGSTDASGWFEASGFYPGRYLLRTRLRRARAADARIFLGRSGGELIPSAELELDLDDGPVAIDVRVLTADDPANAPPR